MIDFRTFPQLLLIDFLSYSRLRCDVVSFSLSPRFKQIVLGLSIATVIVSAVSNQERMILSAII